MVEEILKNPKRKQTSEVTYSKYVPECVRLGKEPSIYEKKPSDIMFLSNKKRTQQQQPTAVSTSQKETISSKEIVKKHANIPQHVNISVGQNKNWSDPIKEYNVTESFDYDEVPTPPELQSSVEELTEEPVLDAGEYGIFIKNSFVMKTMLLTEAESFIEKILFDQLPQYSEVTIDDIFLVRRLALKIGVLAVLEQ